MNVKYKELFIYFSSILFLVLFLYFSINHLIKNKLDIINFIDSDIHEDFEIEITSNLNDINNYLKEYLFIENHLLKRKNNEIDIQITLKKSFAINNLTKEAYFDNTIGLINYFKSNYLDSINLVIFPRYYL